MIQLDAGDIIKMKKKHPCGSDEWQIVKTGADVKLRCCGCSHEIILKRSLVEKNTKKIQKKKIKTCKENESMLELDLVIL
ncbi:MAG: DUF951 domain-containing protein [Lachnospira sp.]